jgi:hypothetical protein
VAILVASEGGRERSDPRPKGRRVNVMSLARTCPICGQREHTKMEAAQCQQAVALQRIAAILEEVAGLMRTREARESEREGRIDPEDVECTCGTDAASRGGEHYRGCPAK